VWEVNVEEEYHEQQTTDRRPIGSLGTGRDAPVIPRAAIDDSQHRRAQANSE
jgi:hypothetical protein